MIILSLNHQNHEHTLSYRKSFFKTDLYSFGSSVQKYYANSSWLAYSDATHKTYFELYATEYNQWEISHGYIFIHEQKYELQWQEVTYLQLGGFVHLKTVEAGCLYSGMLLGSTGLTSPGLKNKLLCLQKWHQTVKSPSTNTKNAWRPFMCVTTRNQNANCLTQVFLRVRKVS